MHSCSVICSIILSAQSIIFAVSTIMSLGKETFAELYIVAIGGSAGSLDPLIAFFDHTPLDSASYIILRHMPKDHQSHLDFLLKRHSKLQVVEVDKDIIVESNKVYIAPSNRHLIIKDRQICLVDRKAGPNRAIDLFLHGLAKEGLGEKAIAVILSGAGFDGASGAEAIKAAGGLVIVQDPASSQYGSMPDAAIEKGITDIITTPSQMPAVIQAYVQKTK